MENDDYELENIIRFYDQITKLKGILRRGWELRGITKPESVADHVFGVCILALIFARKYNLSVEKAVIIALIHDIGETVIGDITPQDNMDAELKVILEEQAATKVFSKIDETGELLELWKDYEYRRTSEGAMIKELDALEMALQARKYEKETNISLDEFYIYVKKRLVIDDLKSILSKIRED